MSVWLVQGALQSTFDCPYQWLDPSLAADTKLVWQQEVTSVGVSDNGLGCQPVDHVSNGNGTETPIRLA